jgi:nucleoid-associated protein YgaU
MACTNPTGKSLQDNKPSPPVVFFQWGTKQLFDAYVRSVSARYTLFDHDGTPLRATVTVAFEEIPDQPAGQNPTSGGQRGRRTRLVQAGETLHSIANDEYRRPALWRAIAEHNRITDPQRLRPGEALMIPPMSEVSDGAR